jgi:hypothetical protein
MRKSFDCKMKILEILQQTKENEDENAKEISTAMQNLPTAKKVKKENGIS